MSEPVGTGRGHRARILYGVSAPGTAQACLDGQLSRVRNQGSDVWLLAPDDDSGVVAALCAREGAHWLPVDVSRRPTFRRDLRTFRVVSRAVTRVRPHVVVVGTPKMSLL